MMQSKRIIFRQVASLLVALVLTFVYSLPVAAFTGDGTTELVSLANDGNLPNNASGGSKVSADGRYVYFISHASNLVPNDTNSAPDIFVRDRLLGTTTRLSVDSSGNQANVGTRSTFDISDDGKYLVFASGSTNLVPNGGGNSIYIRNLQTGVTSLMYRDSIYNQAANEPVISGDGNYIAFTTKRPSSGGDAWDNIYIINRETFIRTRVSSTANGLSGNAASISPDINYDGSAVVFTSGATNLVDGDTNGVGDILLWDRISNSISRVSVSSAGIQADKAVQRPRINNDGTKIVFESYATNLTVGNGVSPRSKVFLHDTTTSTTTLVSATLANQVADYDSGSATISGDGNFVAFNSAAPDLTLDDLNGKNDVFVRDTLAQTTKLISSGDQFATYGAGGEIAINPNGRFIGFSAHVGGIGSEVFLHDRGPDDTLAPSVIGSPDRQPNEFGWYNNEVTISWLSTDPSPSSGAPSQPPATAADLEGTHTYTSDPSCDPAGNCSTGNITLKIDKTPPSASNLVLSGSNYLNLLGLRLVTGPVSVTANASDSISGVLNGEYYIDTDPGLGSGTNLSFNGSQLTGQLATNGLSIGNHTLFVRAQDKAGNWGQTVSITFTFI